MEKPAVHIIGAGLAGLAAAVRLADGPFRIELHEAARQAGGRCRSYYETALGMVIDNGNHLLLSGNHAAHSYLEAIGAQDQLAGPPDADFAFIDLATLERWRLRPNAGPIPWWVFVPSRRVPGTGALDYLRLLRLLIPGRDAPLSSRMRRDSLLFKRLWHPFFLAALNTDPNEGSSRLAAAVVRETLARGGQACRPLVARQGLSAAFIEPALDYLVKHGVAVHFEHRLRAIGFALRRANAFHFGDGMLPLGAGDRVILAVPPQVAGSLVPGLRLPNAFRAIVNAHFKIKPPAHVPPLTGIVNGTIEWLFAFPDRLSVTISGADRLLDIGREELAGQIWTEVAKVTQIEKPLPPWQIIKEKRATFAATPAENARRPGPRTAFANVLLAGDWTATGLPATIEGAIRSGHRAGEMIMAPR